MMLLYNIWFWGSLVYYVIYVVTRAVCVLPKLILYTIVLPVMPFIVAYQNRVEKPRQAKAIYWLWGTIYLLIGFIFIMEAIH